MSNQLVTKCHELRLSYSDTYRHSSNNHQIHRRQSNLFPEEE